MLKTREYTLCSPFRVNAHNSSFIYGVEQLLRFTCAHVRHHAFGTAVLVPSSWVQLQLSVDELSCGTN